jgi:O-acetyl-ADP-ribose deacetylase (regulator of RNase III)
MANAEIMSKQIGATMLELVQGDITALAVDAIVNAANKFLAHGGGVALAIVRKGGPAIETESETIIAERGPLEAGDAVITSGGNLPAKFVIHTVGPVWGEGGENDKLRKAIRHSLALADEEDLKTIAFPAVSTGIYRFPVDQAAKLMLSEAAAYLRGTTGLERVIFCLYDEETFRVFEEAFPAL